jgi:polyhydroxyalkanoate synthesis repressor PhaR
MPLIKRYPNRKLYDTAAKQYITLEGIAALIRAGEEVQVVDHATGEDLTAVTLTQVIFEKEKRRRGFLPQSVLTGLIEAGGETLATLRQHLDAPLELARHVDEEIERRVQTLISRGELAAEEAIRLRDKLLAHSQLAPLRPRPTDEQIELALARHNLPTRQDLQRIREQLELLTEILAEVSPSSESG